MNEWHDNQHKPSDNFRKLLQERIDKANPRLKLTTEETRRLTKLDEVAIKFSPEENVQNRQLQTWLREDEHEQLELRSELKDKPSDFKRYEQKLKHATLNCNRAEGYSSKGKHTTVKKFYKKSESFCEDALEILHYDSSLHIWFDRDIGVEVGGDLSADIVSLPRLFTSRSG